MMLTIRLMILLFLLPIPSLCFANDPLNGPFRSGYSFFGSGIAFLEYEENTTPEIGGQAIDIETDTSLNISQKSGAYVSVNNDWGFYLEMASSLGNPSSSESWQIGTTTVRTNKVAFKQERLAILGSYRVGAASFFLFGSQYSRFELKRFNVKLTTDAASFGIDENTFDSHTVSETVWDVSLTLGYEVNTLFEKGAGWRYQLQFIAGLPLNTRLNNTEVRGGKSFSSRFNGFQLQANLAYGYQFNDNALVAFSLEMGMSRRNPINQDATNTTESSDFPENTLVYSFPALTFYWSF